MLFDNENFTSSFEGILIMIQELSVGATNVFRVTFADNRNPLVVTRITSAGVKVWTSVPQGRDREAKIIGELISEHFKSK